MSKIIILNYSLRMIKLFSRKNTYTYPYALYCILNFVKKLYLLFILKANIFYTKSLT